MSDFSNDLEYLYLAVGNFISKDPKNNRNIAGTFYNFLCDQRMALYREKKRNQLRKTLKVVDEHYKIAPRKIKQIELDGATPRLIALHGYRWPERLQMSLQQRKVIFELKKDPNNDLITRTISEADGRISTLTKRSIYKNDLRQWLEDENGEIVKVPWREIEKKLLWKTEAYMNESYFWCRLRNESVTRARAENQRRLISDLNSNSK